MWKAMARGHVVTGLDYGISPLACMWSEVYGGGVFSHLPLASSRCMKGGRTVWPWENHFAVRWKGHWGDFIWMALERLPLAKHYRRSWLSRPFDVAQLVSTYLRKAQSGWHKSRSLRSISRTGGYQWALGTCQSLQSSGRSSILTEGGLFSGAITELQGDIGNCPRISRFQLKAAFRVAYLGYYITGALDNLVTWYLGCRIIYILIWSDLDKD
jgi:hypothetical protein